MVGVADFARDSDHPAPAGPFLEPARQVAGKGLISVAGERQFDPAVLETDDADAVLERMLQLEFPLRAGKRDQVVEGGEPDCRLRRRR